MISLKNLTLQRGDKLLFSDVNLTFYAKQKIGFIGKNGSGKSSLFALLLGQLASDHGEVAIANNVKIAAIDQEVPYGQQNVIEYVVDADQELRAIEEKLQAAVAINDGVAQANLLIQFENHNGYTAKARAASLLHGLGLAPEDQAKTIDELSGGLRRRLNLARTLFVQADILLLDEPTNHLDLETVIWLEKYLGDYPGLVIIISHDRDFLDNIVTHIAQLEQQKIKLFTGNYSAFETQYAMQLELQQKGFVKQQQQIAHLEKFINRFRYKASKARQAQSRIKMLEKMQLVAPVYQQAKFNFEFFPPAACPHILLDLQDVSFAYGEKNIPLEKEVTFETDVPLHDTDRPRGNIFNHLNFRVDAGMRLGLLGRNGVGKSTLLKLLIRELQAQSGKQYAHHKIQIGYFAQHQLDNLNLTSTPLAHLMELTPDKRETELRAFLGRFDFEGDMALQKVATFSGGEKARLVLALLVWQRPNLLLLDEPTNHLDLQMREALAYALQTYSGAMIIVSHDRHLLRATVDDFYLISKQNVARFDGDLTDYQNWLLQETSVEVPQNQEITKIAPPVKRNLAKNRIQRIEAELKMLQPELQKIENELGLNTTYSCNDSKKLQQLIIKQQELSEKIKSLEEEWLKYSC